MAQWLGFLPVEEYKDLNLNDLPMNHAYVIVNSSIEDIGIYGVNDDCFNCPYKLEKVLKPGEEVSWKVKTCVQTNWRILKNEHHEDILARNNRRGWMCQMRPVFREYGVYRLDVGQCALRPEVAPVNTYLPLYLSSLILLSCGIIYALAKYIYKRNRQAASSDDTTEKALEVNIERDENKPQTLNIFRGLLLCLIIFTTTGGGGYPIFGKDWSGISVAECLFFAFAWSVGFNIPAAMDKAFNRQTKRNIMRDIFLRAFVLAVLGTVIDSTVAHQTTTYTTLWSPLQKLGIAYFVAASSYVLTVQKFEIKSKKTICKAFANFVSLMWCWIIAGFFLSVIAILISTFISFNCLSHASEQNKGEEFWTELSLSSQNCNNEITEYINKIFVGKSERIVDVSTYIGFSKGLMGVMSTIIYIMMGLKAGVVYLHYKTHSDRLKLWGLWATLFCVGGVAFAVASYPLKFNLWPIATIILLSTAASLFYIFSYVLTAIWKINNDIISSMGSTSLAILCGHLLFSNSLPFNWQMYFKSHIVFILQNYWIVSLWLLVAAVLMRKNVKFDF